MIRKLLILCAISSPVLAQTTTWTGIIKDVQNNVVTSGKVTFTLTQSVDATVPGGSRFVPSTVSCSINADGTMGIGTGACVTAMNTAISPTGTSYKVCIQPYFAQPGSCFFGYAITASQDITTQVPTPSTGPFNYNPLAQGIPGPPGPQGPIGAPTSGVNLTPSATQTVTQPGGTTLNVSNFNGQCNIMPTTGTDPSGATDNTTVFQNSINCAVKGLSIPPGTFWVPSITNTNGVPINGDGILLGTVSQIATNQAGSVVTANRQQVNSYADKGQFIFGREYLTHFHRLMMGNFLNPNAYTRTLTIFSGDSTTVGVNVSNPLFFVDQMFTTTALRLGLLGVAAINAGHSGAQTADWISTGFNYLNLDLAQGPDLYVMRWGINDGFYGATPAMTIANIRTGLARIRASHTVDQMSCVLMMPSSTDDNPNNRSAKQYEQLRNGYAQAARDYKCAFIDTYAYLQDSTTDSTSMDAPYEPTGHSTPIIHIHPDDSRNIIINSIFTDAVMPLGLTQTITTNSFYNVGGFQALQTASTLPGAYDRGITVWRAPSANGFPYDGVVVNTRQADGPAMQFNYPYLATSTNYAIRVSTGSLGSQTWLPWRDTAGTQLSKEFFAFGASGNTNPSIGSFDFNSGIARIVSTGANPATAGGIQLIGSGSGTATSFFNYFQCTAGTAACKMDSMVGTGNRLVCAHADGTLYAGTTTTCP